MAAVTSRSDKRQSRPGEAPHPPAPPSLHAAAVGDYSAKIWHCACAESEQRGASRRPGSRRSLPLTQPVCYFLERVACLESLRGLCLFFSRVRSQIMTVSAGDSGRERGSPAPPPPPATRTISTVLTGDGFPHHKVCATRV